MHAKRIFRLLIAAVLLVVLLAWGFPDGARAMLGDLDISGSVTRADLAILDAAYGTRSSSVPLPPNWDDRADIDLNGSIDLSDLTLAGRSFADTFNFGFHRRSSNGHNNNPALDSVTWNDAAADLEGRVHVVWVQSTGSSDTLFYSLLDPSGNPLIEDVEISSDGVDARLAVGPDGGAHIVYEQRWSNSGMYYARLDRDGRFLVSSLMLCSTCHLPAVAVDEYNHAHLVYMKPMYKAMYTILGDDGQPLLAGTQLNPGATETANSFAVTVSPDGARHILWRQATGVAAGELRYTRITKTGEVTTNNLPVAALQSLYNARRYYLSADSTNAVHFLYFDVRSSSPGLYWRRANADGSLSAEKLLTTKGYNSAGVDVVYDIDLSDRIHMLSPWVGGADLGYARLDRDGNFLVPFQRAGFGATSKSALAVDGSGRVMIVARNNVNVGTTRSLFVVSTVADPAANDPNRADLVLDKAHLGIADQILKINETADISVTVTNGGPALASGNTLTFSYPDLGGITSHIDVPVPDLAPYMSTTIQQLIPVPDFESVDSWEVTITAASTTLETTTTNNQVVAAFGVIPPPRMFNVEVMPYDETFAPTDRANADSLPGAKLDLTCPDTAHSQAITTTQTFNVIWDVPLNMNPANGPLYLTTCTLALSKPGFSSASVSVTAQRFSIANPYPITLTPGRPVKLYLNTWGQISGVVSSGSDNLPGAQIKLDSGQTAVTGLNGAYLIEKVPAGNHTMRVWAAGQKPIPAEPVAVSQGSTTTKNIAMQVTEQADVFGMVTNEFGDPLAGADIRFFGGTTQIGALVTGDDGAFAFTVQKYADYTTYHLETSRVRYENAVTPLPALYPGLPLEQNVVMSSVALSGDLNTSGEIISWVQDERWCKSYGADEDVPLRVKILQKIGSKWCPSFQTVVNWGKFNYDFGANASTEAGGLRVSELLITFSNPDFMSYNVSSGKWYGGGETRSVTAQRIDWIELIAVNADGNTQGSYIWRDDTVWYSSDQANPASVSRRVTIDALAPDLSLAAIRVFYTIGQYVPGEQHNFKDWAPPAEMGLLGGSGASSGANRQVITWWLGSNASSMRFSLADYRSALHPPSLLAQSPITLPATGPKRVDAPGTGPTVSLVPVQSATARVGTLFAVDLTLTGFEERPVYGVEYDLLFNTTYFRLIGIQGGADFAGPSGSFTRALDLAAANAAGNMTNAASVRLAAAEGLANGKVVRLLFLPLKMTPKGGSTLLDLTNVNLADLDSDLFTAAHVTDLPVVVDWAKQFVPAVRK